MINSIQNRFDQTGFTVYRNLQDLLTKAANEKNYSMDYDFIKIFYVGDIDPLRLSSQLTLRQTQLATRAPFHSWMLLAFLLSIHLQERNFFQS